MIDIAPAGVAGHHAAGDGRRGPAGIGTGSMEVHRVASGRVAAGSLNELALLVEIRRVEDFQLVGAAEILKGGVGHGHVGVVHEHHMPPAVQGRVLRGEDHVPGEVGDMHRQIVPSRQMVDCQWLVDGDAAAVDGGDGDGLLAGGVGPGAGDHQPVADSPALWNVGQVQPAVARPRRASEGGERGLRGTVNHRAAVEDCPAAKLPGVAGQIDRPAVCKHDAGGDSGGNRGFRRADLDHAAGAGHQRVDPQLGIDQRVEPQRAVDPQGRQLGCEDAIDRDGQPRRHEHAGSGGRHHCISPGLWGRPSTGGGHPVGRSGGVGQPHRRHMLALPGRITGMRHVSMSGRGEERLDRGGVTGRHKLSPGLVVVDVVGEHRVGKPNAHIDGNNLGVCSRLARGNIGHIVPKLGKGSGEFCGHEVAAARGRLLDDDRDTGVVLLQQIDDAVDVGERLAVVEALEKVIAAGGTHQHDVGRAGLCQPAAEVCENVARGPA